VTSVCLSLFNYHNDARSDIHKVLTVTAAVYGYLVQIRTYDMNGIDVEMCINVTRRNDEVIWTADFMERISDYNRNIIIVHDCIIEFHCHSI